MLMTNSSSISGGASLPKIPSCSSPYGHSLRSCPLRERFFQVGAVRFYCVDLPVFVLATEGIMDMAGRSIRVFIDKGQEFSYYFWYYQRFNG